MRLSSICFLFVILSFPNLHGAELVVEKTRPQIIGDKAIVTLYLRNDLAEPIEAARAVVFIHGEDGKVLDQRAQWIVGGSRDRAPLDAGGTNTFHFVLPNKTLRSSTNLESRVVINRLVLSGGRLGSVRKDVRVVPAKEATMPQ